MTALCPSPINELGKDIFAPQEEADYLARGYIFARRVPGTLVSAIVVSKRPIADAVTDMALDSPHFRDPLSRKTPARVRP